MLAVPTGPSVEQIDAFVDSLLPLPGVHASSDTFRSAAETASFRRDAAEAVAVEERAFEEIRHRLEADVGRLLAWPPTGGR